MAAALGSILGDVLGFFGQTAVVLVKEGPVAAARRLLTKRVLIASIWPGMRTVGFIGERLEAGIVGLLPGALQDPARRFAAGHRLFGVFPFPGMGSFRRGVAYRDISDVAEGWLAFFPEMLVEGTQAHDLTFGMTTAIAAGDWVEALDIVGDALAETKLEAPVAFLRGLTQMGQDLETFFGKAGAMTAATGILGDALTRINSGEFVDMGDILDFLRGWRPPPGDPGEPSEPGDPLTPFEEEVIDKLADVLETLEKGRHVPGLGRRVIREFRIPPGAVDASENVMRKVLDIVRRRGG